jgi:hypothetical protein
MKILFIFTGKGAYQARDVENFLNVFDYDYERVCEHDLAKLDRNDLLIVPGGAIKEYEKVFEAYATEMIKFIGNGGTYIGICAGVSALAATGIIPKVIHENGFIELSATDTEGKNYDFLAENPPVLSQIDGAETLLIGEGEKILALRFSKGVGTVLLLAVHAEGSAYYNHHPKDFSGTEFLKKLINSVLK